MEEKTGENRKNSKRFLWHEYVPTLEHMATQQSTVMKNYGMLYKCAY